MRLELTGREHLGDDIWRFSFTGPDDLTWAAGQFIRLEIAHDQPDAAGTSRFFTISAPPNRKQPQITTRLTASSFKQALAALKLGTSITLVDLPAGDFIWPDALASPVLVATGIGITPFIAMLTDRHNRALPLDTALLHSNRTGAFVPYAKELTALASLHPEFAYLPTSVLPEAADVAAIAPGLASSTIFVSGPHKLLDLLSAPYSLPIKQLRTDYFPGYSKSSY